MAEYLALRIKEGKLNYDAVIKKFPQLKDLIDAFLKS